MKVKNLKVKDLKVKNLKRLSNKEIKLLNNRIKNELGILNFGFEKKTELYTGIIVLNKEEMKGLKCYFLNKKIIFFEYDNNDGNEHHNRLIPSLHLIIENNNFFVSLPKVVVDVGAIRFVVNGADIMRPGIRTLEEFEQNSLVIVVDDKEENLIHALGLQEQILDNRITIGVYHFNLQDAQTNPEACLAFLSELTEKNVRLIVDMDGVLINTDYVLSEIVSKKLALLLAK